MNNEYTGVWLGGKVSKLQLFNNDWEFTKQGIGSNIHNIKKNEIVWEKVDIPHDWLIYDMTSSDQACEGWYRKYFSVNLSEDLSNYDTNLKNVGYLLRFEGVYMDSTIFVNGINVGEWKYGYSTFEINITDALVNGVNEIIVKVVLQTPNSRWYSGAGIYRNVWLKTVPRQHFASDGIYITTTKSDHAWNIQVDCEIVEGYLSEASSAVNMARLASNENCGYTIRHTVYDRMGNIITSTEGNTYTQVMSVLSPKLWDIKEPNLYIMKTELILNDKVLDEASNHFGFRLIRFDTDSGFYLNERQVKLHGVCMHHDLGALGAAVNRVALKRQLVLLKEMGANAIRTAHNMCAVELMELADEMGFLIANEAFDMWERPKTSYDYARFFKNWAERDVESWIRRDRNHPCNIMWSIGNEIYDTHAGERGQEVTKFLMEQVYKHDPRHNAFVTIGSNFMPWENAQKCADIVKLAGYNYGEKYYDLHHKKYSDWMIYGSETGSVVQSRGIYHFPLTADILCDDDEQCSSLGNSITSWGARSIEKCITDDRDAKYSAGMFIWSGFDYIGEPTPYHTKNCYFGQLDTAGFKKDSFYIYQAEWTDYKVAPMVHLFPYWDFNKDQLIDVRVCSNAPKVELFFNDISQGTYEIDHINGKKLIGDWQLPYRRGELRAVAYDENNNVIAQDIQRSFTDAARIALKPDKTHMKSDGQDLIFIEITMEDEAGNPVNNANNRVSVKATGSGRLIGLDNGDSTDYDSYKGTSRRLFSGKLLAIIAAKTIPGEVIVEVSSNLLPSAQIKLAAEECIPPSGISAIEENSESDPSLEIPIRRLEIVSPQGTHLNQELREINVEVRVYPENATYEDITWRVTNAAGVETNIANIVSNGTKAKIIAIGDGSFYVRAIANNGAVKPRLISILDFNITGLGTAYLNPYYFISGSLYSQSIGEISNGNERGVATSRDGESIIVYDKLDFGVIGSDTITIPVFELGSMPTRIEIWEGIPYVKGSELLADVIYDKKSIWNTYQEETYILKKRLKNITSLAFLLRSKVHIKGFTFKMPVKAYEQLSILSYDKLYGDDYKIGENCITDIGNNVTIAFDNMDFGLKGINRLTICGRCVIDNSIIVCFKGIDGEVKQLVEFPCSNEFIEREYALDNVLRKQTVEFLFLPGCKFDFKWFRFEE